ncbi:MAG: hypothetical protein ACK4Z0_05660 [Sphingomonadaceae bacterium]
MVALTDDRNTPRREGLDFVFPMAANELIYAGAIVMLNADGRARKGAAATGQRAAGIAQERKQNGATPGAETVRVWPGIFKLANATAADAITQADVGADVFILDDQTVARTNGSGTRSVAGRCLGVEPDGVWVRIGL